MRESNPFYALPMETVESFPVRPNVRLDATLLQWGDAWAGFSGGYESTGARSHYGDYSGEARLDQVVSRTHAGLFAEGALWSHTFGEAGLNLTLLPGLLLRYSRTAVDFESFLRIGEEEGSGTDAYTAHGYSETLRLALALRRGLVGMRLEGGYEHMIGSTLRIDGDAIEDGPRADWSGPRFGVSFGIGLP